MLVLLLLLLALLLLAKVGAIKDAIDESMPRAEAEEDPDAAVELRKGAIMCRNVCMPATMPVGSESAGTSCSSFWMVVSMVPEVSGMSFTELKTAHGESTT